MRKKKLAGTAATSPGTAATVPTSKQSLRSEAKYAAGQRFSKRHPTRIEAGVMSGGFSRNVGRKHHLAVNYTLTRQPSDVRLNKRLRNVAKQSSPAGSPAAQMSALEGSVFGKSGKPKTARQIAVSKQPRDARGRFGRKH